MKKDQSKTTPSPTRAAEKHPQKAAGASETVFPHGGHVRDLARLAGCRAEDLLDFSANLNPLGPPEALRRTVSRHLGGVIHYPDPDCRALREAIGEAFAVSPDRVVCGNGSTELLYALPLALARQRAIIPTPSYLDYATAARRAGLSVTTVPMDIEQGFPDWRRLERALLRSEAAREAALVILGQPNNPSGALFDPIELVRMADRYPDALFLVDEAFADFVTDYPLPPVAAPGLIAAPMPSPIPARDKSIAQYRRDNLIALRSLTKFYAIPGLRLGYALAPAPAPLARRLAAFLPPWSVGSLAQAVGTAALADREYARETRSRVARLREGLRRGLDGIGGMTVFPSVANYLLIRLERPDWDARRLAGELLTHRIAIRVCDNYEGLDDHYFRVAVRAEQENGRLLAALARVLPASRAPRESGERDDHHKNREEPVREDTAGRAGGIVEAASRGRPLCAGPRATPALMIQGTASNAGKSVLTAALCRILLQDGYRVAPFKAQNMSLNSFVTREGGEMGRAQVVQAQACRRDPDVRMNPVLLKPNSETGSQVIVLGKPIGNMDVDAYIRYKPEAFRAVRTAYEGLAREVDVMLIEGAGSPGEVNLKRHDIVNMAMAKYAEARVLLVGDIDRGGVFASFIGTLEVLEEWERALVAGFIINRFRGQRALLGDAIDYVQAHTGLPTFGVIPYLRDLGLPEEDSVTFKERDGSGGHDSGQRGDTVEIALVDLPHISNFTDFDPLELEPDVRLRIIRSAQEIGAPDALILPGSKNVPGDLAWLRESGIAEAIANLSPRTSIVGICGGLQMLGERLADPHGLESADGRTHWAGLSLLPLHTVLEREKRLKRVSARHGESGCMLEGYEIHHGQTRGDRLRPAVVTEAGEAIGFATEDGRIFGTYLHGLYDNDAFRRWFLDTLRVRRGLPPLDRVQVRYGLEAALDRLADVAREHLDMDGIYRALGIC